MLIYIKISQPITSASHLTMLLKFSERGQLGSKWYWDEYFLFGMVQYWQPGSFSGYFSAPLPSEQRIVTSWHSHSCFECTLLWWAEHASGLSWLAFLKQPLGGQSRVILESARLSSNWKAIPKRAYLARLSIPSQVSEVVATPIVPSGSTMKKPSAGLLPWDLSILLWTGIIWHLGVFMFVRNA